MGCPLLVAMIDDADDGRIKHTSRRANRMLTSAPELAIMRCVGARIRQARLAKGMTMQQLADLCRSSQSVLSRVETARRLPAFSLLVAMCVHLDLRISDLFRAAEDEILPCRPGERQAVLESVTR